jgi:outer membrane protein assembly factor BamB
MILVDWLAAATNCRPSDVPLTIEGARVMPYSGFSELPIWASRTSSRIDFTAAHMPSAGIQLRTRPFWSVHSQRIRLCGTLRSTAQNSLILHLEQAMSCRVLLLAALITSCAAGLGRAQSLTPIPKIAVATYHYDNLRTGWNSQERILNPTLCPRPSLGCIAERFGLVREASLDDVVYAQPLVVPDVMISGQKHDVVYVVTENNTVYAIDADTGSVILNRNLGPAVPRPHPSGIPCANNGPQVGIESTPVIDLTRNAMYLLSYTMAASGQPTYQLHAIDLGTLADRMAPTVVAASHKLVDGSTFNFNATDQRQRAALLFEDDNIYAAFGSWCDVSPARGWVLGWRALDLQPLAANILTDRRPVSSSNKLSSIWMSGYGIAAIAGHLYFTTGNSIYQTYNDPDNFSESVVKVSADLSTVLDFFTPSNVDGLDRHDEDLGSGGVLILPDQSGTVPRMAVAAGKGGWMYLLNRTHLEHVPPELTR